MTVNWCTNLWSIGTCLLNWSFGKEQFTANKFYRNNQLEQMQFQKQPEWLIIILMIWEECCNKWYVTYLLFYECLCWKYPFLNRSRGRNLNVWNEKCESLLYFGRVQVSKSDTEGDKSNHFKLSKGWYSQINRNYEISKREPNPTVRWTKYIFE